MCVCVCVCVDCPARLARMRICTVGFMATLLNYAPIYKAPTHVAFAYIRIYILIRSVCVCVFTCAQRCGPVRPAGN